MQIIAKTLTGNSFAIECDGGDQVCTIKQRIAEIENIPVDQQRLVFGGKQLEDEHTLNDYNITPDSTIHIVLALRGGKRNRRVATSHKKQAKVIQKIRDNIVINYLASLEL